MAYKLGEINLLHVPFVNMVVGCLPGAYENDEEDKQTSYISQRSERSMTLTESELMEVLRTAISKCKEGRELEEVKFESPESGEGYMVTLKYKPV